MFARPLPTNVVFNPLIYSPYAYGVGNAAPMPPPPSMFIISEAGDFIIDESGNFMITE